MKNCIHLIKADGVMEHDRCAVYRLPTEVFNCGTCRDYVNVKKVKRTIHLTDKQAVFLMDKLQNDYPFKGFSADKIMAKIIKKLYEAIKE
jgi:hypothetical protein